MPLYSYRCEACGTTEDRFATIAARNEQDCACGVRLTRTYTPSNVIGDDIPGGRWVEHFGHTPERFYSKQAIARRADQLGLVQKGADRWV